MKVEIKRNFVPGSEWLYYKFFCGSHTTDIILIEVVLPVVRDLLIRKLIKTWFYIRYRDPENHIRMRLHLNEPMKFNKILECFRVSFDSYIKTKLVWKMQLDTYQRELERYGDNTIEISETLFYHDSMHVIQFLAKDNSRKEVIKYRFAINQMTNILTGFISDPDKLLSFTKQKRDLFKEEFFADKKLIRSLDIKYRNFKRLYPNMGGDSENQEEMFKTSLTSAAEKINFLNNRGLLQVNYEGLISDYIHMSINRIFNDHQRLKEFICYEFLYKEMKRLKHFKQ